MKNEKGFTLVELLAVIVILAILVTIAITAVLPQMNKAKTKSFINEANIYLTKAEEARAAAELDGENVSCFTIKKPSSGTATNYLNGQYVKKNDAKYDGIVEFTTTNGVTSATIYITNGTYYLKGTTNAEITKADVKTSSSDVTGWKTTCGS